jgi:hypothetical protein
MVLIMDNKNNIPLDLIKLWQEKMQGFFNEPKTIELMMKNMSASQDFFKKIQEMSFNYAGDNLNEVNNGKDDARDSMSVIKSRLTALEQRIAELEKLAASDKSNT